MADANHSNIHFTLLTVLDNQVTLAAFLIPFLRLLASLTRFRFVLGVCKSAINLAKRLAKLCMLDRPVAKGRMGGKAPGLVRGDSVPPLKT